MSDSAPTPTQQASTWLADFGAALERADLDAALALFEEGVNRLRNARERLATAQLRVRAVMEDADGTLSDTELDG